ncbi:MAG: LysR family transcriptional regulator [Burkholderiales bacterium]|nr:LysR family transcriptional regulator [Burkholderiales bacterium]
MTAATRISLEQWRALTAVVDAGGYAQAAALMHKTQSSVSYAVQKMESVLGVKLFKVDGRKAVLTPTGQLLYRRARYLLEEAGGLEQAAKKLSAGWEAEIRVVVEAIFPTFILLRCLDLLGDESPHTRVEVIDSVISGSAEALMQGRADLAIAGGIPQGFLGDALMQVRFVLVAHPDHALHRLGRKITMQDLRAQRQLVVRETGLRRDTRASVEATQRWTVSSMATSIEAARTGYGYAWLPEEKLRDQLAAGTLKPLPLREGGERYAQLYLIFADRDHAGPATLRLAQIVREQVAKECRLHMAAGAAPKRASRSKRSG